MSSTGGNFCSLLRHPPKSSWAMTSARTKRSMATAKASTKSLTPPRVDAAESKAYAASAASAALAEKMASQHRNASSRWNSRLNKTRSQRSKKSWGSTSSFARCARRGASTAPRARKTRSHAACTSLGAPRLGGSSK